MTTTSREYAEALFELAAQAVAEDLLRIERVEAERDDGVEHLAVAHHLQAEEHRDEQDREGDRPSLLRKRCHLRNPYGRYRL